MAEKPVVKIGFADKYPGFVPSDRDQVVRLISEEHTLVVSENPDYLIYSQNGFRHMGYDCVKIEFIAENNVPNFNEADYAIGMHHIDFGDRYVRRPLFADAPEYSMLQERNRPPNADSLLARKFCSYVVSNGCGDPIRSRFFMELSKYKKVDGGGRYLNNVGGPVPDKRAFCSQYKFNIAFENSAVPGYTTEKLVQPLSYFSLPIYFGNPRVYEDFRPECMVRVRDESDIGRAIEEVVYLDTHDEAYLERVLAPCLVHPIDYFECQTRAFLNNIFSQDVKLARRTASYGYQAVIRQHFHQLQAFHERFGILDHVGKLVRGIMKSR